MCSFLYRALDIFYGFCWPVAFLAFWCVVCTSSLRLLLAGLVVVLVVVWLLSPGCRNVQPITCDTTTTARRGNPGSGLGIRLAGNSIAEPAARKAKGIQG